MQMRRSARGKSVRRVSCGAWVPPQGKFGGVKAPEPLTVLKQSYRRAYSVYQIRRRFFKIYCGFGTSPILKHDENSGYGYLVPSQRQICGSKYLGDVAR